MRDFWEMVFLPLALLMALLAGMVLFIMVPAYVIIDPLICNGRWQGASEWNFWGGCLVNVEGRGLIPSGALTVNDVILRATE